MTTPFITAPEALLARSLAPALSPASRQRIGVSAQGVPGRCLRRAPAAEPEIGRGRSSKALIRRRRRSFFSRRRSALIARDSRPLTAPIPPQSRRIDAVEHGPAPPARCLLKRRRQGRTRSQAGRSAARGRETRDGGRRMDTLTRRTGRDAIEMLEDDHERMKSLLAEYRDAMGEERIEIAERL